MEAAGVLPSFTGIAVHDAWAPYDSYHQVRHVLCGAHVLRELQAVIDAHALRVGTAGCSRATTWCWAQQAWAALLDLKALADTAAANRQPPDAAQLAVHTRRLRDAAALGASPEYRGEPGKLGARHRALAQCRVA